MSWKVDYFLGGVWICDNTDARAAQQQIITIGCDERDITADIAFAKEIINKLTKWIADNE